MEYEKIIKQQFEELIDTEKLNEINQYSSQLNNGLSENFSFDKILEATLNGESIFHNEIIIENIKSLFLLEIKAALILCVEISTICIVIALLKNLSTSFNSKSVSELGTLICNIVIIGLCLQNFNDIFILTLNTIKVMCYSMEILCPMLMIILTSMGLIATGSVLNPILMSSITGFAIILKKILLPAIFISTVLTLLNGLTEKNYVNKIASLIRKASLISMGLIMTVLSGVIKIQGLLTSSADGLLLNATKYSISKFIPIVGGFTADTIGLFIKCMTTIKGIVGIFGILLIITLIVLPLIKIISITIIYKCTAIFIEPVSETKLSKVMDDLGTSLITMGSMIFFTSLLFIIFITSIISL